MRIATAAVHVEAVDRPQLSRWFIRIGAVLVLLGLIALTNLLWATLAVAYVAGAALVAGGVLQLAHAVGVRRIGASRYWTLSGSIYLAAGLPILLDPAFGASILTVCVALALGVSGLSRVLMGLRERRRGRGGTGMIVSGIVSTVLAASIIAMIYFVYEIWVLGLIVAADLVAQGVALAVIGWLLGSETPDASPELRGESAHSRSL